jgi:hypothetical protein
MRLSAPEISPSGARLAGRGKLEHGVGGPAADDAAWRHSPAQIDHPSVGVEEDEVEREAHAEGVDAAATGQQKPLAGLWAIEEGEAEQTS